MASVECYLRELDRQRDKLANILTEKGIESDESETYNSLVEKVNSIESSGKSPVGDATTILDGVNIATVGRIQEVE